MNFKWLSVKVPNNKPLTPTQQALLDAIKAAGVRVFDARAWNIRTITALWQAGLIYWNCGPDSDYKQIALIKDANTPTAEESPAPAAMPLSAPLPRVRAYRKENAAAIVAQAKRYLESNSGPGNAPLAAWEGAYVEAHLFDDPAYKHEIYEGTIQEVKQTIYGPYVRFCAERGPSHITGSKWIALSKVKGMAAQTAKATA